MAKNKLLENNKKAQQNGERKQIDQRRKQKAGKQSGMKATPRNQKARF